MSLPPHKEVTLIQGEPGVFVQKRLFWDYPRAHSLDAVAFLSPDGVWWNVREGDAPPVECEMQVRA